MQQQCSTYRAVRSGNCIRRPFQKGSQRTPGRRPNIGFVSSSSGWACSAGRSSKAHSKLSGMQCRGAGCKVCALLQLHAQRVLADRLSHDLCGMHIPREFSSDCTEFYSTYDDEHATVFVAGDPPFENNTKYKFAAVHLRNSLHQLCAFRKCCSSYNTPDIT